MVKKGNHPVITIYAPHAPPSLIDFGFGGCTGVFVVTPKFCLPCPISLPEIWRRRKNGFIFVGHDSDLWQWKTSCRVFDGLTLAWAYFNMWLLLVCGATCPRGLDKTG